MRPAALLVLAALALAACRTARVPPGWVSVDERDGARLHAVSPAGSRLVVREHDNPKEGTLAFWREAVERELTGGRGYELVESTEATGRSGDPAREMLLRAVRPEGDYLYLVVLRVDGGKVVVSEAGGRAAEIEPELPALREALR